LSRDEEFAQFVAVRWARDRDAYAYRVLLNCHRDSRRRHWWRERPTGELPDVPASDLTADSTSPSTWNGRFPG